MGVATALLLIDFLPTQAGPWSEDVSLVSGAAVPDSPVVPCVHCKSPHSCTVTWEVPECNGAPISEYKLEWQPKDNNFLQVSIFYRFV